MKRLLSLSISAFAFVLVAMVLFIAMPSAQASPGWEQPASAMTVLMPPATIDKSIHQIGGGSGGFIATNSTLSMRQIGSDPTDTVIQRRVNPYRMITLASFKRMPDH